jgi:hypothetical protein
MKAEQRRLPGSLGGPDRLVGRRDRMAEFGRKGVASGPGKAGEIPLKGGFGSSLICGKARRLKGDVNPSALDLRFGFWRASHSLFWLPAHAGIVRKLTAANNRAPNSR